MTSKNPIRHLLGLVCITAIIFLSFQSVTVRAQGETAEQPHTSPANILHPYQWYVQQRAKITLSGATDNLKYENGPIMQTATTYAIYWIPSGSSIPTTYQTFINQYFSDIGRTAFFNILTQYYQNPGPVNIQNISTFGGTYTYTGNFPHAGSATDPLTDGDIQNAVQAAITTNNWPTGLNSMYFVFTPLGIESCMSGGVSCTIGVTKAPVDSQQGYCAYHSSFDMGSQKVIYANMPYAATWDSNTSTCQGGFAHTPNDHDADEEISVTSHEHFEAVSDPLVNINTAWTELNDDGTKYGEIGDKCAYIFGSTDPIDGHNIVLNGHPYQAQEEWSNTAFDGSAYSGCVVQHNADVDVALNKSASASIVAGNTLSYNITVTNNDTTFEATDIAISDSIPSGTTFVAFSQATGPSFSCTTPSSGGIGAVTCTRLSLPINTTAIFTLIVNVPPSEPDGSNLSNTASVTTTSNDPNTSNNTSTVNTTVNAIADLVIDKNAITDLVIAGVDETYKLTVTNNGLSDAQNVALVDAIPVNTTFVEVNQDLGPSFTCISPSENDTKALNCTITAFSTGASATFTVKIHVNPVDTSTITNTASVTSSTADPDLSNNEATVATAVSVNHYKQNVSADITTLLSTITDKHDIKSLSGAKQELADSLDPKQWIDGNTLVAKKGAYVFTEEKDATGILEALIKSNNSHIETTLQGFIDQLIAADRALADIAISQASSNANHPKQFGHAQKLLAQGDASAEAGKYKEAIVYYRNAWQHAQAAMKG